MMAILRRPIVGCCAISAVAVTILYIFIWQGELARPAVEIVSAGWSTDEPGKMVFKIHNRSNRRITYAVIRDLRAGSLWVADDVFYLGGHSYTFIRSNRGIPGKVQPVLGISGPFLEPGGTESFAMAVPRRILSRQPAATAWRATVMWSYTSITKWDAIRAKLVSLVGKQFTPERFTQIRQRSFLIKPRFTQIPSDWLFRLHWQSHNEL